jgi:hypothetical protein
MSPDRTTALRHWLPIGALGVALVVANTWPLAPSLDRVGRADSYDGQYGLWQAAWVARAILTDPRHLYDANIFYPHRTTLAFSEPSLLAGILGLPAFAVTASPYATHNLAVLGFFLLSFLSAYGLGRHLTGRTLPAAALGIGYAFCPYVFARTAQLPMLAIFGLPLCLLAMHRLVDRPSVRTALGLAGALFLQALACGYYTVFALIAVSTGLVYFGVVGRRWRGHTGDSHRGQSPVTLTGDARGGHSGLSVPGTPPQLGYLPAAGLAAAGSVLVLLPLFWPHLTLSHGEGFSRSVDEARRFSADWNAWLASSSWAHRWMLPWLGSWNEVLFPGFAFTLLGMTGGALGLTGRLDAGVTTSATPRVLAGFYVLLGLLAAWLAFGPAGGLYAVLYQSVPLFSFIRAAGRFGIVVTLSLGVLTALMIAHLERRAARGGTIAVVILLAIAVELFSVPRPMTPALRVSPVYRRLAELPRGAVLELPLAPRRLEINAQYVLMSTSHWQPIVNGYGAFWPADIQRLAQETDGVPSAASLDVIRAWGVRYLIVHPRLYEAYGLGSESEVLRALAGLERLQPIAGDKDLRLYEIAGWTGGGS